MLRVLILCVSVHIYHKFSTLDDRTNKYFVYVCLQNRCSLLSDARFYYRLTQRRECLRFTALVCESIQYTYTLFKEMFRPSHVLHSRTGSIIHACVPAFKGPLTFSSSFSIYDIALISWKMVNVKRQSQINVQS